MLRNLLIFATSLCLLSSCSSYQSDFRSAVRNHSESTSPAGPWKGEWTSEANGHHGPLWCLLSPDPNQPDTWNFRYRAGWGVLQFGDYTHQIKGTLAKNGNLPVEGKMTLPNNFGTYAVKGQLTKDRFDLRFQGNGDQGTMTLARP